MEDTSNRGLTVETEPDPADICFLEAQIYEFNVKVTGISDGELNRKPDRGDWFAVG
jgi:hypothetical protein